jgi:hypothetical protein
LQLRHLQDLSWSWERRIQETAAAQNAGAVDFAPRYFTSATRDLHRAVAWYSHLKKNNLLGNPGSGAVDVKLHHYRNPANNSNLYR